ncbi:MAG: hypothetical protein ACJAZF_000287 [Granulosicoccus sp.]|jgi:hypothetical protein
MVMGMRHPDTGLNVLVNEAWKADYANYGSE